MFAKGQNIIQIFEQLAPKRLAMTEDKIGLQVGSLDKEVKKVMLTLDVLENVVDEAIEKDVDLIISHHAVIFNPLKNLRTDLARGRIYQKLLKHDIAVYVAHSNLDAADHGVNDALVKVLGFKDSDPLSVVYTQKLKKLVVFVPNSHHQQVLDTLANNGAGWIGNYSHCSFNISGTGTFMPLAGSNPYIGSVDSVERVDEIRIETIVPEDKQKQIIQAMLKAHPYEEVAYDIYPLEIDGKKYGIGKIVTLEQAQALQDFANFVKKTLQLDGLRVVGDFNKKIKKVAIVGGDGNDFVKTAAFKGADVLITGDIYYHVAHEAVEHGIAIIDAGHNIEKYVLNNIKSYFIEKFNRKKIVTEVIISEVNTNPFQFM